MKCALQILISRSVLVVFICTAPAWAQGPSIRVNVAEGSVYPGEAFRVSYEVSWPGNAQDYAILPPIIESIDWGEVSILESVSSVRNHENVVSLGIEVIPAEVGEYEMPKVLVQYVDRLVAVQRASESKTGVMPPDPENYPALAAEGFAVVVRPDRRGVWLSGGIVGALLATCLAGWFFFSSRSGDSVAVAAPPVPAPTVENSLHAAKRARLDGNYYEFYRALHRAVGLIPKTDDMMRLQANLQRQAQDVGYRGVRPSEDEMNGVERDVERMWSASRDG